MTEGAERGWNSGVGWGTMPSAMVTLPLRPDSDFSRAVFKLIRPHIPRERWPVDAVRGRFEPAGDGMWLEVEFDDFPANYAALAAQLVREARVDLVLKSPAAYACAVVVRTKRWRDVFLYGFLPLMFAIPMMAALSDNAMRMAGALFSVDLLALVGFQAMLTRARANMAAARFIANIPSPGLKLQLSAPVEGPPLGGGQFPEV
jgi:hypothetical protein